MASEFESGAEPKDRTKYMWGVVILVFVLMVVALSFQGRVKPNTSVVRLKHILIQFSGSDPADESRAREVVRGLRERILNGEDFGKLAAEFSNDPRALRAAVTLDLRKRGRWRSRWNSLRGPPPSAN